MVRRVQDITPTEAMPTMVFLADTASAGETVAHKFTDGSIRYFERILRNSFLYTLLDNIGTGSVRVSFNRPDLDITTITDGAKTLKAGDSLYIEEHVWHVKIYFIESSTIEIILKSDKDI